MSRLNGCPVLVLLQLAFTPTCSIKTQRAGILGGAGAPYVECTLEVCPCLSCLSVPLFEFAATYNVCPLPQPVPVVLQRWGRMMSAGQLRALDGVLVERAPLAMVSSEKQQQAKKSYGA